MRNKGKYVLLWKKYLPAMKILLKRAVNETQTLKFYKHELNIPGTAAGSYVFDLKIADGRPVYKTDSKAIASDLMDTLADNEYFAQWLKNKSISISMNASCQMNITLVEEREKADLLL